MLVVLARGVLAVLATAVVTGSTETRLEMVPEAARRNGWCFVGGAGEADGDAFDGDSEGDNDCSCDDDVGGDGDMGVASVTMVVSVDFGALRASSCLISFHNDASDCSKSLRSLEVFAAARCRAISILGY
jgi:hypothetical protein